LILAIDPGRKPAYALLDTSNLVERRFFKRRLPRVAGSWEALPERLPCTPRVVVVEGQWLFGPRNKSAILHLALEAGWQLCAACMTLGGEPFVQPVNEWREALGVGGRVVKKVAQNRCRSALDPAELSLLATTRPARLGDRLDAILVGWGWWVSRGYELGALP